MFVQTDASGLCWFGSHAHVSACIHAVVVHWKRLMVAPQSCPTGHVAHDVDMIFGWYVPAGHGCGHCVGSGQK